MLRKAVRIPLVAGAALVGFAVLLYVAIHAFVERMQTTSTISSTGSACPDPASVEQLSAQNNNKALFITCGGFLE